MSLLFGFSVCIKGARRHIFKIAVMCKTRTAITKTTISFFTFASLPWYVKFTYYTDEPWVTVVWDKENLTNRVYIQTKFRNFQFHYRLYLGGLRSWLQTGSLSGYIRFHIQKWLINKPHGVSIKKGWVRDLQFYFKHN